MKTFRLLILLCKLFILFSFCYGFPYTTKIETISSSDLFSKSSPLHKYLYDAIILKTKPSTSSSSSTTSITSSSKSSKTSSSKSDEHVVIIHESKKPYEILSKSTNVEITHPKIEIKAKPILILRSPDCIVSPIFIHKKLPPVKVQKLYIEHIQPQKSTSIQSTLLKNKKQSAWIKVDENFLSDKSPDCDHNNSKFKNEPKWVKGNLKIYDDAYDYDSKHQKDKENKKTQWIKERHKIFHDDLECDEQHLKYQKDKENAKESHWIKEHHKIFHDDQECDHKNLKYQKDKENKEWIKEHHEILQDELDCDHHNLDAY